MLYATATLASDSVVVLNTYGLGGTSQLIIQYLAEGLTAAKGWKTEQKNINNCALVKSIWDSNDKALMLSDHTFNATPAVICQIPTTADNIVIVTHRSALFFCNNGPNGKTLEDFLKPGSKHVVADTTNVPSAKFYKAIMADVKNEIRFLSFLNSNQIAAAAKSGDADFILATGPWPEQQLNAKCFWTTGDTATEGYTLARDIWPKNRMLDLTFGYWVIAKGFSPSEMEELRKTAHDIWSTNPDWIDMRKKRKWNDELVPRDLKTAIRQIETDYRSWTDAD
jgi:hypothetical protein